MDKPEIREQIEFASRVVEQWPAWKRNILMHSSEPTNSSARQPVILWGDEWNRGMKNRLNTSPPKFGTCGGDSTN